MKQIDIIKTYAQKRCLVVDDLADARSHLKRLLADFGVVEIDTAGSAEEAIELCERNRFDIVLADYNLGAGKNGQQLLEELRYHRLLSNTSIYIMVTAESASNDVLHALENQPDDYLSKPIAKDVIRPRLDQALMRSEALSPIKLALDEGRPNKALAACEKLLPSDSNTKSKFTNDIKKIYAELLFKREKYREAKGVYQSFPDTRKPLWARLGIANVRIQEGDYDQAKQMLSAILADNQYCIEAHDLLAQIYLAEGQIELAQHELSVAVKLSPRSIQRQRELGKVSEDADDLTASVRAYRSAVKHSKNSCQESAEDYINLSQSLTNLADEEQKNAKKHIQEALDTVKILDKKFNGQPIYSMRGRLIESDIFDISNQPEKALTALHKALDIHSNLKLSVVANTPPQICLDCAKALMKKGQFDEGELLLKELAEVNDDPSFAIKIDMLRREPSTREGRQYAAKQNKLGVTLYEKKDYEGALIAFTAVLNDLPSHIGLNLNLIQALISKHKLDPLSNKEHRILRDCFNRIGLLQPNSQYHERFGYLARQSQKLGLKLQ